MTEHKVLRETVLGEAFFDRRRFLEAVGIAVAGTAVAGSRGLFAEEQHRPRNDKR